MKTVTRRERDRNIAKFDLLAGTLKGCLCKNIPKLNIPKLSQFPQGQLYGT